MITVSILGLLAAIAAPQLSSTTPGRIELAASQFTQALRFAQSEALRTGQSYGCEISQTDKRIRLFKFDAPPARDYAVYHPVTKQIYDIKLDDLSLTANIDVDFKRVTMIQACVDGVTLIFNRDGVVTCANPTSAVMRTATITLSSGENSFVVGIDGLTGRVTIQ